MGNETLRPLGVAIGNAVSVTLVWSIHIKTQPVGRRQPMTSLPARPQYKGRRENFVWSLRRKHGTQPRGHSVSFPTRGTMVTYATWDVPLHGNFELRPLGVAMGNDIPTPPYWGECKPISYKRLVLSHLYLAKGVVPGTGDDCQWPYPLRPKTRAAYPKTLPVRCRDNRTQGRAQKAWNQKKIPLRGA